MVRDECAESPRLDSDLMSDPGGRRAQGWPGAALGFMLPPAGQAPARCDSAKHSEVRGADGCRRLRQVAAVIAFMAVMARGESLLVAGEVTAGVGGGTGGQGARGAEKVRPGAAQKQGSSSSNIHFRDSTPTELKKLVHRVLSAFAVIINSQSAFREIMFEKNIFSQVEMGPTSSAGPCGPAQGLRRPKSTVPVPGVSAKHPRPCHGCDLQAPAWLVGAMARACQ